MSQSRRAKLPRHPLLVAWVLSALLAALGKPAQIQAQPTEAPDPAVLEQFRRLEEHMPPLVWEKEFPVFKRAMDRVWERNGWTDEADRYAHDLACEVGAIPPSQVMKRLSLFNQRITERYGLTPEQAARFRSAALRESAGFLMRNAGIILEQTRDFMEARAHGEPFTAEQVARWAKEGEPFMAELRERADRLTDTLKPMLTPDSRQVLERDFRSFEKRQRYVDRMGERWAKGQWQPEDWGLEGDPVQTGAARVGRATPRDTARHPAPDARGQGSRRLPKWSAQDPSTWFAYVLEIERRFRLDPGQVNTAESIHAEVLERAEQFSQAHAEALKAVPARERKTHEAYEPIRSLFGELQGRLDAIPTTSQRHRADE